jgi:hypothetical protein
MKQDGPRRSAAGRSYRRQGRISCPGRGG